MTRQVFANAMVAHVWAQQDQPSGRSHNGNFYFEGRTIYSYGHHFPAARFVQTPEGGSVVLVTTDRYSVSTAKHLNYIERALNGLSLQVFHVPNVEWTAQDNLRELERSIVAAEKTASRAKSNKAWRLRSLADLLTSTAAYARTFGIEWTWPGSEAITQRWQAEEAAYREAQARKAQEHRLQDEEDFKAWRRGAAVRCPSSWAEDPKGSVYLRVSGDDLETSRGAVVPLEHAVKVFRFVKLCRERGEGFKANGRTIRVGHFTVSEVTPEGDMRAGCHFISWERMSEVAGAMGLTDVAPSEEVVTATH